METAVLKVLADTLLALDSGNLAMLTLLDLSAAFDSVDHNTLLQYLTTSYGLGGVVIDWFASYLSGHAQFVQTSVSISCRLWSSSGFSPRTDPVPAVCRRLIATGQRSPALSTCVRRWHTDLRVLSTVWGWRHSPVSAFIIDMSAWMKANIRLQLNPSKT